MSELLKQKKKKAGHVLENLKHGVNAKEKTNPLRQYKIVKQIGSGGFSTVYLVRHKENGKMFALKQINKA